MEYPQDFLESCEIIKQILENDTCVTIQTLNHYEKFTIHEHTYKPSLCYGDNTKKCTYPWSDDIIYGGGIGGSYTSLKKSSKQILKLLNRYHYDSIDDLKILLRKSHKHKNIKIALDIDIKNLPKHWNNMVFCDGTMDDIITLNKTLAQDNEKNDKIIQDTLKNANDKLIERQNKMKKEGKWYDDKLFERYISPNLTIHIADIANIIGNDNIDKLKEIIDTTHIFDNYLFDLNYSSKNYKGHRIGRKDINALINCSYNNSQKCMKLLIDKGANVNYQNKGGSTALHIAGRYGYIECVKMLVDAGIDKKLKENDGMTAYDRCMVRGETECANLCK